MEHLTLLEAANTMWVAAPRIPHLPRFRVADARPPVEFTLPLSFRWATGPEVGL